MVEWRDRPGPDPGRWRGARPSHERYAGMAGEVGASRLETMLPVPRRIARMRPILRRQRPVIYTARQLNSAARNAN